MSRTGERRHAARLTLLVLATFVVACAPRPARDLPPALEPTQSVARLDVGSGHFVFAGSPATRERPVTVWYHQPAGLNPDARVVIVMHGASRNGETYRNAWVDLAVRHRFLLVVPEFSERYYPNAEHYNLGNMFAADGKPIPDSLWSYSAIEPIFDEVKRRSGNRSTRYIIYGHSAGGQFVHRFMMFRPQTRVDTAIAANSGWYTMPTADQAFPYGMKGLDGFQGRSAESWSRAALERPMIVLLGSADTARDQDNLRRTPEAMAQGPHRFARGHAHFEAARREAARLHASFRWRLDTVPGVAHSNARMAPGAVAALGWTRGSTAPEQPPQRVLLHDANASTGISIFRRDTDAGASPRSGGHRPLGDALFHSAVVSDRRLVAATVGRQKDHENGRRAEQPTGECRGPPLRFHFVAVRLLVELLIRDMLACDE
jgi:poly(3-hydroxybutyrate) depolymerase